MTAKSAQTAEPKKRKKYTPYRDLPHPELNIDQPYGQQNIESYPEARPFDTADVATLVRVIQEKDRIISSLSRTNANQQDLIAKLFKDVETLKDELANPNLFIAQ